MLYIIPLTNHWSIEIHSYTPFNLLLGFECEIRTNDHRGIAITLHALLRTISFDLYDIRHKDKQEDDEHII